MRARAAEMARVCRPGGRIGLANWTPEGFIGQLFRTLGRHLPPPAGVQPPALWGTEAHLRALFGDTRRDDRRHAPASSTSAIGRPRTSSTCSAPGTARCTRRSRRWATRPRRSSATSPRCSTRANRGGSGGSWCRASTSRSSSRGADGRARAAAGAALRLGPGRARLRVAVAGAARAAHARRCSRARRSRPASACSTSRAGPGLVVAAGRRARWARPGASSASTCPDAMVEAAADAAQRARLHHATLRAHGRRGA